MRQVHTSKLMSLLTKSYRVVNKIIIKAKHIMA